MGDDEAADDDEAEGAAGLGGRAADAEGNGDGAHHGREGGHEDGAKPCAAGVIDGGMEIFPF